MAPGDRVAYLLPNVPELVVAHFGCAAGGRGARLAINTRLASEEIRYICDHAEAVVLVVDDEQAPIAINYTSGTTGRPKGVVYTHRGAHLASLGGLAHAGHSSRERLPVDAADVPLQRLVHGVGRHGRGRHPGVPPRRARRARSGS